MHKNRTIKTPAEITEALLRGSIPALSKAITLVESKLPQHRDMAAAIIRDCLPHSGRSKRIGITGVPGVGKSSFIERFGMLCHQKGNKIAVLAIDPSSAQYGGSILGDKTRMQELSALPDVFIRPSPAGEHLGGVHRCSRETILLCEAAGFDTILIETVGVGQSETEVYHMTDVFLLLALPGAGDELQGIKRGIMELADIIAINKTDGNNILKSNETAAQISNALHFFPERDNGWTPQVIQCSALEGKNIDQLYETIERYINHQKIKRLFEEKRHHQWLHWFENDLKQRILTDFFSRHQTEIDHLKKQITAGNIHPGEAVDKLFKK